ncbi:arylamine N-acetyltransferase [Rossellomorea marisflavi]|uniref:Arylamine N-acetyltransferase n=1 Tax=Rossellomorea marisflavi TaxID=189381 RepID=A0A5D4RXC3_9BACI|nr:arylamine N-acetyltransferase [Rossellomorea marisflavi]TYS55339.1 arylamine N-acetyltransferase [Rossellomorea marisflavi]
MDNVQQDLNRRIGMEESWSPAFAEIPVLLKAFAKAVPFENMAIIEDRLTPFSEQSLKEKILVRGEGGLCYDLNGLLYLYLKEAGFSVTLVRGVVYHQGKGDFHDIGRTHVLILLEHGGESWVVDGGFGGNIPLKPVPLTGEVVTSANGDFRIAKEDISHGDYILQMKLSYRSDEWQKGYAFDTTKPVTDLNELAEVQKTVSVHPESPFNRSPLLTKRTDTGSVTLTKGSMTEWKDGRLNKKDLDDDSFNEYRKKRFNV